MHFIDYFFKDSATAAAWAMVLIALVSSAGILASFLQARIAKQAFLLTVPPSVDVSYSLEKKAMVIRNTSQYDIVEIKMYVNAYTFGLLSSADGVMGRSNMSGPIQQEKLLEPNREISVEPKLLISNVFPEEPNKYNRASAFTVVFRRAIDGKRFVIVEPFIGFITGDPPTVAIMVLHQAASTGNVGSVKYMEIFQTIERMEKFYYGEGEP